MSISERCPELATKHNGSDGWTWRLRSPSLAAAASFAEQHADNANEKTLAPLVVQHQPYLLKSLPLESRIERLGAGLNRRHASLAERYSAAAECINTLELERRLVPVPRVLGFGEKVSGLEVTRQAILFEADGASRTLTDSLARAADNDAKIALLERAGTLIEQMFRAGYVPLNISSDTIRLGVAGNSDDRLVHLELVDRVAPRQQDVLAIVFALLFKDRCADLVPVADFDRFAARQMAMSLNDERPSPWLDACYRYFKARDWPRRRLRRVARGGLSTPRRWWVRFWADRHR